MRGYSRIYTDGHSIDLSAVEADTLKKDGLIEPHPGAGYDGITSGDWILAAETTWEQVTDALADLHRSR